MASILGYKIQVKAAIYAAILSAFVLIAFAPAFNNGFTNWDDEAYVLNNNAIKELTPAKAGGFFYSFTNSNYHPLTMLSYSLEYSLFNNSPSVYHATNILIHLINCFLVFRLIWLLCGNINIAFAVALLFGIHPLRVESVAWISERKDVLYSLFYICALIQYYRYRVSGVKKHLVFFSLAFLLSLLSKGSAVTLPFAAMLIDYYLDGIFEKKRIISKIPFAVISVLFTIIGILAQSAGGALKPENAGLFNNLLFGIAGIGFYIEKFFLPFNLSNLYPRQIGSLQVVSLVVFLVSAFFAVLKKNKSAIFGLLFFLVTILPSLQFVPLGEGVQADRYSYIPFIGLFFVFCSTLNSLYERTGSRTTVKLLLICALGLTASGFTFLTQQRSEVWENSITLWTNALKTNPANKTALNSRGAAYNSLQEYDKAIEDYKSVLIIDPANGLAYYNRGLTYINLNRIKEAREFLNTAMKFNPRITEQCKTLLSYCDNQEKMGKSIPPLKTEKLAAQFFNLGNEKMKEGLFGEAIINYSAAIQIDNAKAEYYNNRGIVYTKTGQYDSAYADFKQAIILKPNYTNAMKNLGKLETLINATQFSK